MNRYTVKLQILQENNEYDVEEDEERDITFYNHQSMPAINVRMLNYNKQTRIKDLKAIIYDEFISVTGTVVKISNIRPFVKRLAFECQGCNTTFVSFSFYYSII
jgi:DNA replicative helicase MCM subunit Mcm2 (Cdc46/Mcm family)